MCGNRKPQRCDKSGMRIRFFGRLRDTLGDEREVAAEAGETVKRLRIRLAALHPEAARDLLGPRVRAFVDDRIVGEDFLLGGREQVEFLPPLSGG
jgi:molybdopterin converting factor small subunit